MSGDAEGLPECEMKTLMTPGHTEKSGRRLGWGSARIGHSSREGLNMGCHKKAPVECPCSRLATLHDAPWLP